MIKFLSKFIVNNSNFYNLFIEKKIIISKTFKINARIKSTSAMCSSVNKIETFVFFDLETSDLIKGSKMPKIIELSMVAVARNSIKSDETNKLTLPRIMHKLTIPICPKQPINVDSSRVSNLWNHNLEDIKPFDESTYNLIMQFIERLPGIICFVAHNGNRFDYPIFLSELQLLDKTLPNDILCVDTLEAFREILSKTQSKVEQQKQNVPQGYDEVDDEPIVIFEKKKSMIQLDDGWNDALSSVLDKYEKHNTKKNECIPQSSCKGGKDKLNTELNEIHEADCYPSRPTTPESNLKLMQAINEKTPESQIIRNPQLKKISRPSKSLSSVKRQLTYNKPKNFKLATIYEYMIGCEAENLHCSETDCIAMLRCICQIASSFIEWSDLNAKPLNNFAKSN